MKQRFRLGDGGALIGRDGLIYGYLPTLTIDLLEEPLDPAALGVGGSRLSLNNGEQKEELTTPDPRRETSVAIDQVWAHYVDVMHPRQTEIDAQGRGVIRDALTVAKGSSLEEKVAELNRAIDGCKASPFHMGVNDRRKKYNRITQILKGKRGGKTMREQIDMFLDLESGSPSSNGKSDLSAGVIESLKDAIRSFAHTGAERERAERAKATLIDKGVYSRIDIDPSNQKVEFIR